MDHLKVAVIKLRTDSDKFTLVAPIINVDGAVRGNNILLESTTGELRLQNSVQCKTLSLVAREKSVRVACDAYINCCFVTITARNCVVDGKIFRDDSQRFAPKTQTVVEQKLNIELNVELLHVGLHGIVGAKSVAGSVVDSITGYIKGKVANFGTIIAKKAMVLNTESIVSLATNKDDTAHRGYEATKYIQEVSFDNSGRVGFLSGTELMGAVLNAKGSHVAALLERNVDPNDLVRVEKEKRLQHVSPRKAAKDKYAKAKEDANRSGRPQELQDITTVMALFDTKSWRRGVFKAPRIELVVDGNVGDCAQFEAAHLTVSVSGDVECEANSIWTSGFVQITTKKGVRIYGQVKLARLIITADENVISEEGSIVAVDQQATVMANGFSCFGEWYVEDELNIRLNKSCICYPGSFISSSILLVAAKQDCVVSGEWLLSDLSLFITNLQLVTHTGNVTARSTGSIACRYYRNGGKWQVQEKLQVFTETMEQSKAASITVEGEFRLSVLGRSDKNWCGVIKSRDLFLRLTNYVQCDGSIETENIEIQPLNAKESQFMLKGEMRVKNGPVTIVGKSFPQDDRLAYHHFPNFVLSGKVDSQGIIAPRVAINLTSTAEVVLTGVSAVVQDESVRTMIHCGWLDTSRNSVILAAGSENDVPQRFICEETWIHEGELRQSGTSARFFAKSFVNAGVLTFIGFDNQLLDGLIYVGERMVNKAPITAVNLRILGTGVINNCSDLLADNSIAIKAVDLCNLRGRMQADNISVQWLTDAVTNLAGMVNVRTSLSMNSLKTAGLDILCTGQHTTHFDLPEKLLVKSSKILRLAVPVHCNHHSKISRATLHASGQIVVDSQVEFPHCTVSVNDGEKSDATDVRQILEPVALVVNVGSSFITPSVNIRGHTECFSFALDGRTVIENLAVSEAVHTLTLQGNGPVQTLSQISHRGKQVELGNLSSFETDTIDCTALTVMKDKCVFMKAVGEIGKVSATENILIEGEVQINGKLLLSSKETHKPHVSLTGKVVAVNQPASQLHVDSSTLKISGMVQNFEACSVDAKTTLDICESGSFLSIQNLSVDGEWVTCKGKIADCKKVDLKSWGILNSGEIDTGIEEVEVNAGLVLANIGKINATRLAFGAPFLFNISLDANKTTAFGTDANR